MYRRPQNPFPKKKKKPNRFHEPVRWFKGKLHYVADLDKAKDEADPTRKPCCYGYIRCSTKRQFYENDGLDVQEDKITKFFEYELKDKGFVFGGFFRDPFTSTKIPFNERKAGQALMRKLRRGDCVVIAKLDRGFRDTIETLQMVEKWRKDGVALHMLDFRIDTGTEMGLMQLTIAAAFARWERSMIRGRMEDGRQRLRDEGYWMEMYVPYGFKRQRVYPRNMRMKWILVPNPEQRRIPTMFYEQRMKGMSYKEIAAWAREQNIRTSTGTFYYEQNIPGLVYREARYRKLEAEGRLPIDIVEPGSGFGLKEMLAYRAEQEKKKQLGSG